MPSRRSGRLYGRGISRPFALWLTTFGAYYERFRSWSGRSASEVPFWAWGMMPQRAQTRAVNSGLGRTLAGSSTTRLRGEGKLKRPQTARGTFPPPNGALCAPGFVSQAVYGLATGGIRSRRAPRGPRNPCAPGGFLDSRITARLNRLASNVAQAVSLFAGLPACATRARLHRVLEGACPEALWLTEVTLFGPAADGRPSPTISFGVSVERCRRRPTPGMKCPRRMSSIG